MACVDPRRWRHLYQALATPFSPFVPSGLGWPRAVPLSVSLTLWKVPLKSGPYAFQNLSCVCLVCPACALSDQGIFPQGLHGKGRVSKANLCVVREGEEGNGPNSQPSSFHSIGGPAVVVCRGIPGHTGAQRPVVASGTGWGLISQLAVVASIKVGRITQENVLYGEPWAQGGTLRNTSI